MSFDRMLTFPRSATGWRSIASSLADGCWHSLGDLGEHLAATTDLKSNSARTIVDEATAAGHLQKRRRKDRQVEYRVTAKGLDSRPELRVV